jgi:uncharacterized peroxidase-related enzyme
MSRIPIPTRDDAPASSQPILDAVYKQLGFVPNLHRLMSISPDVLAGFVGLQSSLAKTLDIKTRDAVALAVSESNGCGYCIAAHSYVATNFARMSPEEIALNRQGGSHDVKRAAATNFAQHLIKTRGKVSDANLQTMRDAGYSNAQIIEMVALSAEFLLTTHRLSGHTRPAGCLKAGVGMSTRASAMPVTDPQGVSQARYSPA